MLELFLLLYCLWSVHEVTTTDIIKMSPTFTGGLEMTIMHKDHLSFRLLFCEYNCFSLCWTDIIGEKFLTCKYSLPKKLVI